MRINLGEKIRALRKNAGFTQEQLAEALGVTTGAVYKWESGRATPEIELLVEIAGFFETSVDAMLDYRVQSGTAKNLEERIHNLQIAKDYESAVAEAEKALIRYPNDFRLVYRCGEMYQLMGIETGDIKSLERAIELLNHAILLLSQNEDPQINAFSIQAEIAQCYIVMNQKDKGLELLKKYNADGVHNALIGLTYAISEDYQPQEAEPYLMKAFGASITSLVRIMTGYANYYARMNDFKSSLDAILWITKFLESIKIGEDTVSYVDKICGPFYAECAHLSEVIGRRADVEPYLRKALETARRFDANPVYNISGIRFCIGEDKNGTVYDDIGASSMDAIENQLQREYWSDNLRLTWKKLKEER